ncbi:LEAF RUST 10 DISEASE-RESISTANCE LOCUS RECEPTOR-LIKE PROTEIN KINASE-like 2.1 [Juglans microcarpa x Juglans regia]|uniref:LEAF RUST 10 DISEASE-RESISTANCE LOCUS RECEPTOR-LIKE PROTEIN KINASE-like 2.1 n=1 Tax=Juglans microcarpa x Juglans regia TaxID=2249226 RepID=UPI001B7E50B7|nr:LEAF RUST 10 DISEASE-RESISTANCE LOCUS RECEPTOR-LIKE PROTEIN KINASE-like 2.1 [Juglans microcarpa x Juglans regia]
MHPFSFPPLILFSVLLFSFFSLIASFPSDVSAVPFSSDCPQTFDCGDLKNISYPFTLRDDCGLPEFRLTCENDSPELAVESISYRILLLNQTEKTMTLARSDLWNKTCPHEFFNSTLNRNVFDYGKVNEDLTIFYGCSNLTQMPSTSNLFNCSIDGNPSSDAFFLVGPIPTDPILRFISCTVGVNVKILKKAVAELTNNRSMLREVLMEGFNVNYSTCANCLVSVSGGQCGFDSVSAQPICLCDNQPCPAQGIRAFFLDKIEVLLRNDH